MTDVPRSSESRLASVQPADPAPTITMSVSRLSTVSAISFDMGIRAFETPKRVADINRLGLVTQRVGRLARFDRLASGGLLIIRGPHRPYPAPLEDRQDRPREKGEFVQVVHERQRGAGEARAIKLLDAVGDLFGTAGQRKTAVAGGEPLADL